MKQYAASDNPVVEPSLKISEPAVVTPEAVVQATAVEAAPKYGQASSGATDRRKHRRHAVKTKIVVMLNGQVYRAFSKDISVGGLLLMNQIPWKFENTNCTVFVSNPRGGQALEFTGKVLSDPKDPCRFEFQNPAEKFLITLNQWLEESQLNPMNPAA
jgi:hypothetical protein